MSGFVRKRRSKRTTKVCSFYLGFEKQSIVSEEQEEEEEEE